MQSKAPFQTLHTSSHSEPLHRTSSCPGALSATTPRQLSAQAGCAMAPSEVAAFEVHPKSAAPPSTGIISNIMQAQSLEAVEVNNSLATSACASGTDLRTVDQIIE
eukprot:m.11414 g.11414  ORF g.11414 m.11414 type:complete len:106 (-) comp5720_c0_seq1:812-1129(-)